MTKEGDLVKLIMENDIVIIGAGIGGLTLARALQLKGINFQLYEQASSFEALGYGLQLSPNVVRVFQQLNLDTQIEAISHRCFGFELRSFDGDYTIASWQLNHPVPYYQCRRADLHKILFDAIEDKNRLHFSRRLLSYSQENGQLFFSLEGETTPQQAKAIIGADGIHSQVRRSLFPHYQPQYSGYSAYRAILPFQEQYQSLWGKATVWMGKNHHVVAYPNGKQPNETSWLNLVLVVKNNHWMEESWSTLADKNEVASLFHNQSSLLNQLLVDMVSSPQPCLKWGLFTYPPLPYWSQGKVTLLGDAVHAMLPFQAQGAGMAIESAYILAHYISQETDIETAFLKYQQARIKRVTKAQQTSKNNARIFHAQGIKAIVRNTALTLMSSFAPNLINQKSAWIYDYDITATAN